jgi:hypothetical protein
MFIGWTYDKEDIYFEVSILSDIYRENYTAVVYLRKTMYYWYFENKDRCYN